MKKSNLMNLMDGLTKTKKSHQPNQTVNRL